MGDDEKGLDNTPEGMEQAIQDILKSFKDFPGSKHEAAQFIVAAFGIKNPVIILLSKDHHTIGELFGLVCAAMAVERKFGTGEPIVESKPLKRDDDPSKYLVQ